MILSGSTYPEKSITLQTSKGTSIKNRQVNDSLNTTWAIIGRENLKKNYLSNTFRPNTFSSVYNCHGLTFANRRTGIDDGNELVIILTDDNYKEIGESDVLVGDIVLYFSDDGTISHSGIVVKEADASGGKSTIRVLGKWGDAFEVVHYLYNSPYGSEIKFYRCEINF